MVFDEALVERVRELLVNEPGLTGKKMFGGYAFLLDGNMCAGVERDRLIARVPADEYQGAIREPNISVWPNPDRPMRNWIGVEADGIAEDEDLARWVQPGVTIARSLPPK